MYEEAIVEIYGRLETDIVIRQLPNGKQYGETKIAVSKRSQANAATCQETYQTTYFSIFIWNQELLASEGKLLKNGLRVLLIGKLELLDHSYRLIGAKAEDYLQAKPMVVSISRNRGITIISQIL